MIIFSQALVFYSIAYPRQGGALVRSEQQENRQRVYALAQYIIRTHKSATQVKFNSYSSAGLINYLIKLINFYFSRMVFKLDKPVAKSATIILSIFIKRSIMFMG